MSTHRTYGIYELTQMTIKDKYTDTPLFILNSPYLISWQYVVWTIRQWTTSSTNLTPREFFGSARQFYQAVIVKIELLMRAPFHGYNLWSLKASQKIVYGPYSSSNRDALHEKLYAAIRTLETSKPGQYRQKFFWSATGNESTQKLSHHTVSDSVTRKFKNIPRITGYTTGRI